MTESQTSPIDSSTYICFKVGSHTAQLFVTTEQNERSWDAKGKPMSIQGLDSGGRHRTLK